MGQFCSTQIRLHSSPLSIALCSVGNFAQSLILSLLSSLSCLIRHPPPSCFTATQPLYISVPYSLHSPVSSVLFLLRLCLPHLPFTLYPSFSLYLRYCFLPFIFCFPVPSLHVHLFSLISCLQTRLQPTLLSLSPGLFSSLHRSLPHSSSLMCCRFFN